MQWVFAEIRIENETQARAIRQLCADNEMGPTIFVAYIQGRRWGRVIVKSQLSNWAMTESAIGAAGFQCVAAATSPLEADELSFDGLATYFHALAEGRDLGTHLAMVAVEKERGEKGNESAAALARRLASSLEVGAEIP
jgi:hypothetical protein